MMRDLKLSSELTDAIMATLKYNAHHQTALALDTFTFATANCSAKLFRSLKRHVFSTSLPAGIGHVFVAS